MSEWLQGTFTVHLNLDRDSAVKVDGLRCAKPSYVLLGFSEYLRSFLQTKAAGLTMIRCRFGFAIVADQAVT